MRKIRILTQYLPKAYPFSYVEYRQTLKNLHNLITYNKYYTVIIT